MVCLFHLASGAVIELSSRLFELAPSYFDISGFPEGETKRALERIMAKKRRMPEANGPRRQKKQKVEENRE